MPILENIALASYTTLGLGGAAKYFSACSSLGALQESFEFARQRNLRMHILAGGSNTIFSDHGFNGLIVKIDLNGISFAEDGNDILVTAKAGEQWETVVTMCVAQGYAGIECLSGIPGSVGATPIQNVGAYGQEVKDTIESVKTLERSTLSERIFRNAECGFSYRTSRFKTQDAGNHIVTEVTFRLQKNGRPTINYPEVKKSVEQSIPLSTLADGRESLEAVRGVVLSLRKKKSMVIDPYDPNTRSVGSFFTNPVVDGNRFTAVISQWRKTGDGSDVPSFPFENNKKIPAAWLIEKSGFQKGYSKNGAGISENHTLALVNRGGTTAALLSLAKEIQDGVEKKFGLRLELEPVVIL